MSDQSQQERPQVVSRAAYSEGGYTFLKRALRAALEDQEGQVIIDSGGMRFMYTHNPENETFMDGVTVIEGDVADTLERFSGVAGSYFVQKGLAELAEEAK